MTLKELTDVLDWLYVGEAAIGRIIYLRAEHIRKAHATRGPERLEGILNPPWTICAGFIRWRRMYAWSEVQWYEVYVRHNGTWHLTIATPNLAKLQKYVKRAQSKFAFKNTNKAIRYLKKKFQPKEKTK